MKSPTWAEIEQALRQEWDGKGAYLRLRSAVARLRCDATLGEVDREANAGRDSRPTGDPRKLLARMERFDAAMKRHEAASAEWRRASSEELEHMKSR